MIWVYDFWSLVVVGGMLKRMILDFLAEIWSFSQFLGFHWNLQLWDNITQLTNWAFLNCGPFFLCKKSRIILSNILPCISRMFQHTDFTSHLKYNPCYLLQFWHTILYWVLVSINKEQSYYPTSYSTTSSSIQEKMSINKNSKMQEINNLLLRSK